MVQKRMCVHFFTVSVIMFNVTPFTLNLSLLSQNYSFLSAPVIYIIHIWISLWCLPNLNHTYSPTASLSIIYIVVPLFLGPSPWTDLKGLIFFLLHALQQCLERNWHDLFNTKTCIVYVSLTFCYTKTVNINRSVEGLSVELKLFM